MLKRIVAASCLLMYLGGILPRYQAIVRAQMECSNCAPTRKPWTPTSGNRAICLFGSNIQGNYDDLEAAVTYWNDLMSGLNIDSSFSIVTGTDESPCQGTYDVTIKLGSPGAGIAQTVDPGTHSNFEITLSQADINSPHHWVDIITHELGHTLGLNDVYSASCEGHTVMYWQEAQMPSDSFCADENGAWLRFVGSSGSDENWDATPVPETTCWDVWIITTTYCSYGSATWICYQHAAYQGVICDEGDPYPD